MRPKLALFVGFAGSINLCWSRVRPLNSWSVMMKTAVRINSKTCNNKRCDHFLVLDGATQVWMQPVHYDWSWFCDCDPMCVFRWPCCSMFNNAGPEGCSSGGGGGGIRVLLQTTSLLPQQTKQKVRGSGREKWKSLRQQTTRAWGGALRPNIWGVSRDWQNVNLNQLHSPVCLSSPSRPDSLWQAAFRIKPTVHV